MLICSHSAAASTFIETATGRLADHLATILVMVGFATALLGKSFASNILVAIIKLWLDMTTVGFVVLVTMSHFNLLRR